MARKKKSAAPAKPEESSVGALVPDGDPSVRDEDPAELTPEQAAQLDTEIERAIIGAPPGPSVDFDLGPVDRARASRRRRLARADVDADTCAVLGIDLDLGPRARPCARPVRVGDLWCSAIGAALLEAGVTADDLEHAAEWLRDRAGAP